MKKVKTNSRRKQKQQRLGKKYEKRALREYQKMEDADKRRTFSKFPVFERGRNMAGVRGRVTEHCEEEDSDIHEEANKGINANDAVPYESPFVITPSITKRMENPEPRKYKVIVLDSSLIVSRFLICIAHRSIIVILSVLLLEIYTERFVCIREICPQTTVCSGFAIPLLETFLPLANRVNQSIFACFTYSSY